MRSAVPMLFRAGPVGPRQGVRRLVGAVLVLLCAGLVASKAEGLDLAVGPAGPFSAQALVPTFRAPPMVQDPVTGRNFTFVNEELVAQRPDGTYLDSLPAAQPSGMVLHNGAIFVVRGRAPHLERVDPATLHVTHVMELPELFRGGRMWSIPGGLLSFYEGGVAVIDPVARTIRHEWFVMPGNADVADWVDGTTMLAWTSGNELGVIDFSSTPMRMINRVSFGPTHTAGGLVSVGVDRLLVSGLAANGRTVELTIPGLTPTGYEFIGGGGVGLSPDGRWIGSAGTGPSVQLHFLRYGEVTPVRTLEYLGSHESSGAGETFRWTPDGARLVVGNGYYSPDGALPDLARAEPVVPVPPPLSYREVPMPDGLGAELAIEPSTRRLFAAVGGGLMALDATGTVRTQVLAADVEHIAVASGAVYVMGSVLRRVDPVTLQVTATWPIYGGGLLQVVDGRVVISQHWQVGVLDPQTGALDWIPTGVFEWQTIMRSPSGAVAITCERDTGTFFRLDVRSRPYQLVRLGRLYDHQFCHSGELSADGSTLLMATGQARHVEELRFDPLRIDGLRYGRTNGVMTTGEGWLAGYGHDGLALFRLGSRHAVGRIVDPDGSFNDGLAIGNGRVYVLEASTTHLGRAALRIVDLPGAVLVPSLPLPPSSSVGSSPPASAHGALGEFHAIGATRSLDTRQSAAPLIAGAPRALGLPALDGAVGAVLLNITVVAPTQNTYVKVWSARQPAPFVSNVNVSAGETRANLAVVPVEPGPVVNVETSAGQAHVVVDVLGWFSLANGPRGDRTSVIDPARVLDTRSSAAIAAGGGVKRVDFAGRWGVPVNAKAVLVNITALTGAAPTFVTGFPAGAALPGVSHVYAPPFSTVPNLALVPLGEGGAADFFSAAGAHLVIDVMGYTAPPKGDEAGRFLAVSTPTRTFDTRSGGAAVIAGVGSVQVVGGVVVPGAAGLRPVAVVMNTTVTDASEGTYLTVHAPGLHPPVASNLNVGPGVASANLVVSRMDGAGAVNLVNGAGSVHAIGDVAGYLSAP